jgi:hypothetical protein
MAQCFSETCGYLEHAGCCEGCVGHTMDGQCVTMELLEASEDEDDVRGA